jgi:hypothetical protein
MLNLITRAPGSLIDSNLVVDSAIDSDPSSEGVEIGSRRHPSCLARGHEMAPQFSRYAASVTKLAARTFVAAGTTAALSPMAMAADSASGFGVGHAAAFAAGAVALKGIQMIRAKFATKPPATME